MSGNSKVMLFFFFFMQSIDTLSFTAIKILFVLMCFWWHMHVDFKTLIIFSINSNLDICIDRRAINLKSSLGTYFVWRSILSLKPRVGTQNYNLFDVSFTKACPWKEIQSIISSLALLFRLKFGCVTSLACWLCTAFIWSDTVSLVIISI